MATKLFLGAPVSGGINNVATTHLGTNLAKLDGTLSGWSGWALDTTLGDTLNVFTNTSTVAGTTLGVEITDTADPMHWISPPVAADVTISGTVTGNVWAAETNMSANVAINFVLDVIRATDNSIVQIVKSANVTEVAVTTRAVNNFTATPGAGVTVNKGDRLRVRIFGDDAGTMAAGFLFHIGLGGPTAAADGDSWVQVNETVTFLTAPSGTVIYLTDTASAVSTASVDREAWTARGAGVQTDDINTVAGWTAPLQWTDTAGGTVVDWFTRPLTAFTLTGLVKANVRAQQTSVADHASLRVEIARVAGDGTSPTVWASWCLSPYDAWNDKEGDFHWPALGGEHAEIVYISGDDLAVSDGQRLRIRAYLDDTGSVAMASGGTVTLYYAGTSGGASGDSFMTFTQTLTEFVAATDMPYRSPLPPLLAQ